MFQVQILRHTVHFTLPSKQGLHVKTWDCYNGHLMIGDREAFWSQDRHNNHSLIEKHTWHDDFRKTKFSCNSCLFCYKEWMLLPYLWLKKTTIMMETKTEENNNNKPGRPEYTPSHTTLYLFTVHHWYPRDLVVIGCLNCKDPVNNSNMISSHLFDISWNEFQWYTDS